MGQNAPYRARLSAGTVHGREGLVPEVRTVPDGTPDVQKFHTVCILTFALDTVAPLVIIMVAATCPEASWAAPFTYGRWVCGTLSATIFDFAVLVPVSDFSLPVAAFWLPLGLGTAPSR